MKRIFAILTMALMMGAFTWAKEANEIRIYLNPGHGSWTANDRPMGTMKHGDVKVDEEDSDTSNFYETNTNLQKAFSFLNQMVAKGISYDPTLNQPTAEEIAMGEKGIRRRGAALDMTNNIVMSHVHAGPYPTIKMGGDPELAEAFNRSLSEISLEVDANNFDYFLSIHSNAATEGTSTNYPLILYRGSDAEEQVPGSKALAQDVWPEAWRDEHAQWTYYGENNPNIRGDWSFYGSHSVGVNDADGYLGVLKHHAIGFLIEGYFHTYQPARTRYMNDDVAHQEGIRYARGFAKHLGLPLDEVGYIYGVARNGHEKINEKYYKPNGATIDKFYPINDLTVTLKKGDEVVATYTTDDEFNGAYVFGPLEPGTYKVTYSHPDFKDGVFVTEKGKVIEGKTEDEIVVTANATSFLTPLLERTDYVPPTEEPELYPDPVGKGGIAAAPRYNLKPKFEDVAIENLAGATVRRTIQRGEKVFILAADADNKPVIDVFNTKTGEVTPISVEGADANNISTTYLTLSDIQVTADGVLLAINKEKTQYNDAYVDAGETRGKLRVYKWETDAETGLPTGNPALWFESASVSGNFYRAITGETFAYSGTSEDGVMTVSSPTATGVKIREAVLTVVAGELGSVGYNRLDNNNTTIATTDNFGQNYNYVVSPLDEADFVSTSDTYKPLSFAINPSGQDTPIKATANFDAEYGSSFFKYGNKVYMATPAADALKLFDVSAGIDKAKEVDINIASIPENTPDALRAAAGANSTFATGTGIAVKNADDEVIAGNLELVVLRGDKITVLTTEDEEQPVFYNSYAYDLQAELDLNAQLFSGSFKLLKEAPATVQILDPNTNEVLKEVEPVMDGVNGTFSISTAEAPAGQTFTWAVKVENEGVPSLAKVESGITPSARGIAIDNDPASPFFGHAVVTNPYAGANNHVLYALTPDHQSTTHTLGQWNASNTASPHRVNINPNNHKAYVADWSDAHAGVWIFDPANPDAEMVQMFEGTKGSGGEYTYEGTIIGGGGTGGAFWGTGADTRYYYFSEDCPTSNNSNVLVRYNIGENERINFAPNAIYNNISGSSYMLNTDVNITAASNGVFVSQNRTTDQNTTGVPAFVYANLDGEVLFNSGDEALMGNDLLSGIARGGLAISADEKTFAVSDAAGVVKIFDVAWNENVPSFTLKAEKAYGSVNHQMAFDYAGNLLLANQGNGVSFFAVPCDANEVVTPSCKNFTLGELPKLYVLGEVGENGWAPNVGQEMTAGEAGMFSTTITCDGRNEGYNYFSFTEKLADNADDWDAIAPYRYGAVSEGDFWVTDEMLGKPLSIERGQNAFRIAAGEYEVAVDLNAMTTTITATSVAAPEFSPAAGEYEESVEVTITAEEGAEIRYTLDGSEPTVVSALYAEPIVLNEIGVTTTIKALAVLNGVASDVASATYTVVEKPEPKPEMVLTKVWEIKTSNSPTSGDARFATGFNETVYVANKATGEILAYNGENVSTFATVEGLGVGITSDDAGNILVNKGFPDAGSFSNWVIIEPNGTQHELTIEAPDGIEAARLDQAGRVVGDVMSEDGGYLFLTPNGQTAVAAVKIASGAFVEAIASPAVPALTTSYIAQPMFATVEETEAFADPSAAFYLRTRSDNKVNGWTEDASEQLLMGTVGSGGNEGFDYFWYDDEFYAVASTARTNEFCVKNLTKDEIVATNADDPVEAVGNQFRAYVVRKINENAFGIYVWNAGYSAGYYIYGDPSGVESVAAEGEVVATTYYNLQGVRVVNPSAGQILIKVDSLSNGKVRSSKVLVR